jgi:light-regulated signal transduction histidine kinase (bacteriophytochrome)
VDVPGGSTEPKLDLSSCDREPIHIPGSVQPHGFLLSLDPGTLTVLEASENAAGYLELGLASIFDHTVQELLPGSVGARLQALLAGGPPDTPRLLGSFGLPTGQFDVVAHKAATSSAPGGLAPGVAALELALNQTRDQTRDQTGDRTRDRTRDGSGDRIVVEFECIIEPADMEAINARLYNFISANRGNRQVSAVAEAAVAELRALTGCDRVVLYRFDEQGHGLVLAEDRGEQFESYLGLRFPASDVPQQARRLYERNRVRIIPNVNYAPSPLVASGRGGQAVALDLSLDLSQSILRSVSPVHLAYMRNMGTACSMSVSILVDGRLWGLVSCHHHEPHYVSLRLRSACDFVMQVVGSQIESQQNGDRLRRVLDARAVQSRLLAAMAAGERYMDGLLQNSGLLMALVQADGVAVIVDGTIHLFGSTPAEAHVRALAGGLGGQVLVTSQLSELYPPAEQFTESASGMVAVSFSKIHTMHVLWFRREQVATVRWAGDPLKPAVPEGAAPLVPGVTVSPRQSFAEWQQTVRGRSAAWRNEEIAAVGEFRSAVFEIVLRQAEELAELAAGLRTANQELEAFSYSVSHDLRAPFRHISGFSELLREEEADRMSESGKRYLATIMESARFAGQLVDSLLDFSRIARTPMRVVSFDMEALVDQVWAGVLAAEGSQRRIQWKRSPLPRVAGDPQLLGLVLRNLFSNAMKYTGKVEQAVIEMDALKQGQETIFAVRDNGVGFDQKYAGKLFGVFQRLHRAEDFEGTGIGLANVRRIVARHGGRTWATGEQGRGAAFFFTLPIDPPGASPQEGS